ncbi:MAG: DUF1552 domain-containing protein [Phycisphaeraceae bacterium]|nr:DUF1552 domain-containing protein [Phycisphaeraceae bacterium]
MTQPARDNQTNFNITGQAKPLSRRTMLKGLGVAMALPMLDAMAPGGLGATQALAAAGGSKTPTRMAFVFAPNGVNYDHWLPKGNGSRYQLSPTLKPLESVRQHVNIMTGLTLDKARANGDGPGDHARSSATFLTGTQARKTSGNDIRLGISIDQFAAQQVGGETRLPSLEIGMERGRTAGNCDSGYSCAYSTNVSWADEDSPVPKMTNPLDVFERMFGELDFDNLEAEAGKQDRLRRRASILDYVMQDTQRLERRLGKSDRNKIDEFQTSIREIERRVQMAKSSDDIVVPDFEPPAVEPTKLSERIDLMYDMMRLAFQMDVTRISTFMLGNGGSNKRFDELDILDGHHTLSHHRNNAEMVEKIRKIDRYYTEGFARFVKKMADTPDGTGSLLDHSMILFGSGICDGNRHNHENLPMVMAGRANGSISTGRLLNYRKETPLCNLYVSMLDRMGADVAEFGDATGRLEGLKA